MRCRHLGRPLKRKNGIERQKGLVTVAEKSNHIALIDVPCWRVRIVVGCMREAELISSL